MKQFTHTTQLTQIKKIGTPKLVEKSLQTINKDLPMHFLIIFGTKFNPTIDIIVIIQLWYQYSFILVIKLSITIYNLVGICE